MDQTATLIDMTDDANNCPVTPPPTQDFPPIQWGDLKEEDVQSSTPPAPPSYPRVSWMRAVRDAILFGRVKWFSDKLGYGFISILRHDDESDFEPRDVFVHHSGICPHVSSHRMLVEGEYVCFSVTEGPHGAQAIDVTGVFGGPLMCDVAHERKEERVRKSREDRPAPKPRSAGAPPARR